MRTRKFSGLDDWMKNFRRKRYYAEWKHLILYCVLSYGETHLAKIYEAIRKGYPDTCVDYVTYLGGPKWKHLIRAVLADLKQTGLAETDGKGNWHRLK